MWLEAKASVLGGEKATHLQTHFTTHWTHTCLVLSPFRSSLKDQNRGKKKPLTKRRARFVGPWHCGQVAFCFAAYSLYLNAGSSSTVETIIDVNVLAHKMREAATQALQICLWAWELDQMLWRKRRQLQSNKIDVKLPRFEASKRPSRQASSLGGVEASNPKRPGQESKLRGVEARRCRGVEVWRRQGVEVWRRGARGRRRGVEASRRVGLEARSRCGDGKAWPVDAWREVAKPVSPYLLSRAKSRPFCRISLPVCCWCSLLAKN